MSPPQTNDNSGPTVAVSAIVVIEDDDEFFGVLTQMLKRTSFASIPVNRCSTLVDGLSELSSRYGEAGMTIVLCDQSLPDSQPESTLSRIVHVVDEQTVVIAMTALDNPQLAETVSRLGVQDYFVKDESHPRHLERRIRAAIERHGLYTKLERANAELDAYAKLVSHDLKSPLAVLMVNLDALSRHGADPERVQSIADSLREECQTMVGMIDAMLDLARGSKGTSDDEWCMPEEAVADAVKNLRVLIAESGADVSVAPVPPVVGSVRSITHILQNLIANGIHYNQSEQPTVRITGTADDGNVVIVVEDNGIGVAPEHAERIFEMGQRANNSKDGTGLGLAIARKHAQRLGGKLYCDPRAGAGSRFVIELLAYELEDSTNSA